ncbi:hypothetical protein Asppvi_002730 [Aspergillus pseudoviridinutans]|uniref:HNH nuclease domain-containing protein n=1 Tax=Aspergillus pseudoviridinutans TaxID=1517512 RepID=A0A9P3B5M2_9EURO|nr:uncharacterized protein Asppvi_002730 [Aspergillus pseudoviridinutans]GIJ83899.1 hypothetical protein Asppvi_002730 [Aspergillus pseudoviridinutans]
MPPRKSRRLARLPPEDTGEGRSKHTRARKSNRQPSEQRLSVVLTEPESPETLPNVIDAARKRVKRYKKGKRPHDQYVVACLNACLDWFPGDGPDPSLAKDIVTAGNDKKLWEVFHNVLTGVLYPMMAESRKPPVTASPHEANAEVITETLLLRSEVQESEFRKELLRRDGYRCCVTRWLEQKKWIDSGRPNEPHDFLEATNILPFSFAYWAGSQDTKEAYDPGEVLLRCFPALLNCRSRTRTTNSPSNGMMLLIPLHMAVGSFHMAFVKTDERNVYDIKTYPDITTTPLFFLPSNRKVTFECAKGEDIPLPDPAYLDCHYRVAEILHASGLAEYIERKIQDWEDLKQSGETDGALRPDGSTDITRILNTALWTAVAG